MQDERFEWDDEKARSNVRKHGITFEAARFVFSDPNRIEEPDEFEDEDRWIATGMSGEKLLVVIYAERIDRIRIVSARKARNHEQSDYFR